MNKFDVPSKSERDDGGNNEIGIIGFLFGAIIWTLVIYTILSNVF